MDIEDARDRNQLRRTVTLKEAIDHLDPNRPRPWCACIGPPNCCMNVSQVALEVQREAQLLANLARAVVERGTT